MLCFYCEIRKTLLQLPSCMLLKESSGHVNQTPEGYMKHKAPNGRFNQFLINSKCSLLILSVYKTKITKSLSHLYVFILITYVLILWDDPWSFSILGIGKVEHINSYHKEEYNVFLKERLLSTINVNNYYYDYYCY